MSERIDLKRRRFLIMGSGFSLMPLVAGAETGLKFCSNLTYGLGALGSTRNIFEGKSTLIVSNFASFGIGLGNLLMHTMHNCVYLRNFFSVEGLWPEYRMVGDRIGIEDGVMESRPYSIDDRLRDIRRSEGVGYVAVATAVSVQNQSGLLEKLRDMGFQIVFISLADLNEQRANYILSRSLHYKASFDGKEISAPNVNIPSEQVVLRARAFDKWQLHFERLRSQHADKSVILDEREVFHGKALENFLRIAHLNSQFVKDPYFSESLKRQVFEILSKASVSAYT